MEIIFSTTNKKKIINKIENNSRLKLRVETERKIIFWRIDEIGEVLLCTRNGRLKILTRPHICDRHYLDAKERINVQM